MSARVEIAQGGLLDRHLAQEERLNRFSPLVGGNRCRLLLDGPATYKAMDDAIGSARDHVNLQVYMIQDDEVGKRFADALISRSKAGVQVNLIYDSVGSLFTPSEYFDRLRDAGVRVVEFNPVNPWAARARRWRLAHRDHRKLLIVDGRTAFVGGINISEVYSSGSVVSKKRGRGKAATPAGWRDTHLMIQGPVVAEFQRLFFETWSRQDGPPIDGGDYFPKLDQRGDDHVRAIGSTPRDRDSALHLTLLAAIRSAAERVWLTVAYFAPDEPLLDALVAAAGRGVDVRMLMPCKTDAWPVFHCGRSYYEPLLAGGVRIFERQGPILHAKTAVVDGVWSTVGSSNLDWRSKLYNDELNAVVLGTDFGERMEAVFVDDIGSSREITLAQWRVRPWPVKALEWSARLLERAL